MTEVYMVLAGITGALIGALAALSFVLADRDRNEGDCYYAAWLGRRCSARFGGEWVEGLHAVAVSWRGAVAVRGEGWHKARWIGKEEVPERVRWEE